MEIDGGTINIATNAENSLFVDMDPEYAKTVSLTGRGVTFNTLKDADARLGMPLTLTVAPTFTSVVESVSFSNPSYEQGTTGWGAMLATGPNGSIPARVQNGTALCTTWLGENNTTLYGDYFMVIRSGQKMLTTVSQTVPTTADNWYVSFACATRPNNWGDCIDVHVTVSNVLAKTEQTVVLPRNGFHAFKDVVVGPFSLAADEQYVVTIENGWDPVDSLGYGAMCYDNFSFTRLTFEDGKTPVTKTGLGRLTMDDWAASDVSLGVQSGALALNASSLTAMTSKVASNAHLIVADTSIDGDSEIAVADGGKLTLTDSVFRNYVANGSFETYESTRTLDLSQPVATGWTLTAIVENENNQNGKNCGGGQGYGGNVTVNGPSVDGYGTYSAAVRQQCRLSQSVTVDSDGDYKLSFLCAKRKKYTDGMVVDVKVDDGNVLHVIPSDSVFIRYNVTVHLTAGVSHTIAFETDGTWTSGTGPLVFIEDVWLTKVGALEVDAAIVDMKPGSTLVLDNVNDIRVTEFRVNGVKINGKRNAIQRAGVNVLGDGNITVGTPGGMSIIIR